MSVIPAEPSYEVISYQRLLAQKYPPEMLSFLGGSVSVSVYPFDFGEHPDNGLSIVAMDEDNQTLSLPVDGMPGLSVSKGLESGPERGASRIGFMNYEKEIHMESLLRIVVPEGFAYGIHPGHMGKVVDGEVVIAPEAPGYYLIAKQIGVVGLDGSLHREQPTVKHFSLRRIEGFLGSPNNDPEYRARYNIY